MKNTLRISLMTAACVVVITSNANAAAFYLQEQGSSGLGTAYAGAVADTPDASTIFYNPAGMTELEGRQVEAGVTVLLPKAEFKNQGSIVSSAGTGGVAVPISGNNGGNPFDTEAVPHAYFSAQLSEQFWIGIGVTAPFGLANEYDDNFVGRYNSTQNMLKTINVAPTVAWKINDQWSVGAGFDVQYASAVLKNAVPSPATAGGPTAATDGETRLAGTSLSTGFNAGVQYKPFEGTKLGLAYRSGVSHTLEGTLGLKVPGNLGGSTTTLAGQAELDLPDMASFGISQKVGNRLTLLGSVNWYQWSNFDDIPVMTALGLQRSVQDYQDTWGFAGGARYQWNDNLTLKAGLQYDQTPTVDEFRSTRIPDGDRWWIATGATYNFNDRLSLDLSGAYVMVSEEKINLFEVNDIPGAPPAVNIRTVGETSGSVGLVSAALKFKF